MCVWMRVWVINSFFFFISDFSSFVACGYPLRRGGLAPQWWQPSLGKKKWSNSQIWRKIIFHNSFEHFSISFIFWVETENQTIQTSTGKISPLVASQHKKKNTESFHSPAAGVHILIHISRARFHCNTRFDFCPDDVRSYAFLLQDCKTLFYLFIYLFIYISRLRPRNRKKISFYQARTQKMLLYNINL